MNQKQRTRTRRLIAWTLVIAYMIPDLLPGFIASAMPQMFVHPGAGVSRLPLQVGQFNAAGFGDLNDAVNLANGSVYVGTDSVSYNSKLTTGDESTNTVGGSGWNLTQRMRLNGFNKASNANFGLDNLTLQQNPASNDYYGYYTKPNVLPVNRLLSQDSPGQIGTCGNNYVSGVFRNEATPSALNALPVGKYRLSFDGRADGNLGILYGLDDAVAGHYTTGTILTTSWQTLTGDYTIAASDGLRSWLFDIYEGTQNNPAWEVANIKLYALNASNVPVGANLITNQDFSSSYYQPVCAKPAIETAYRMQSADNAVAPLYYSGLIRVENTPPTGRFRVSLDARTRNGALQIIYGVSDGYTTNANLTTNWQPLSFEFNIPTSVQNRIFQVYENTANNPDWEIKNLKVQHLVPSSFTLSQGDGSGISFTQQAITTPAQLTALNPPSWISRYSGVIADSAFYTINAVNGKQYSKEWIVLRRVGTNNMIAHYYDANGNRVSFHNDGEYADYTQNSSQQYRSATLTTPDPEGEGSSSPKTELSYTDFNAGTGLSSSGLISKTRDEYGRINAYTWNTASKTLDYVYQLVQDDSTQAKIESTWQRKTQFLYCTTSIVSICPNTPQRLLTDRIETTYDGKTATGVISRTTKFTYQQPTSSDPVLLRSVSRQILNGSAWKTTFYSYTGSQVSEVKTVIGMNYTDPESEPATSYTYGTGSAITLMNSSLPILTLEPNHETTIDLRTPISTFGSSAVNAIKNLSHKDFKTLKTNPNFQMPTTNDFKARVATFTVPTGFATDLYRLQVQVQNTNKNKGQSTLLSFKTNGVQYQNGTTLEGTGQQTLNLGEQNLRPGQVLEVKANSATAKFSKLTLVPLMVSAGPAQTSVIVTQGIDVNKKKSGYYFDANGQLVRKEVRDYNPYYMDYMVGNPWTSGPWERNLIWYYNYSSNGSTSSVISPSGRVDTMDYDANGNGNLTSMKTFAASGAATPVREQIMTYDTDNRMTNSSTPALVGTGYNYGLVEKPITYTMTAPVTPLGSGQTFTTLDTLKTESKVATVLQFSNTLKFDTNGRVIKTTRTAAGSSDQIIDYVYHNGTTFGTYLPNTIGTWSGTTNPIVKQYGDQPYSMTKVGISGSILWYDAFGNLVHERIQGSFKADVNGTTVDHTKWFFRSYNGFGQQVWNTIYTTAGEYLNRQIFTYYATGELTSSWSGNNQNVTNYNYFTTGTNAGRLYSILVITQPTPIKSEIC